MRFIRQIVLAALGAASHFALFAQAPDFRLADVSLSSPRRGAVVSPRDYILQVSGFYFGAAY